ncbi:MAG TPA: hypothetical protein VGN00_11240 [Puia sp.]|jgi:hypothetical protein
MPYSKLSLGKTTFSSLVLLLLTFRGLAVSSSQKIFQSTFSLPHNSRNYALYNRDTVQEHAASGYVRRAANGDLVITVPQTPSGRYKIRFFDEGNALLFEIRQIRDPLLIVEKYNFEHAGQFRYELYRDSFLVEKSSFAIRRE